LVQQQIFNKFDAFASNLIHFLPLLFANISVKRKPIVDYPNDTEETASPENSYSGPPKTVALDGAVFRYNRVSMEYSRQCSSALE
jgi:hypothetical protein